MELNRHNMRKIMLLITFTVVLLVGLQHVDVLVGIFWVLVGFIQPLWAGMCIAYILNVPMKAIENLLFVKLPGQKGRTNTFLQKIRRPVSLVLTIVAVVGVLLIAVFIVGPELGKTFSSLGGQITTFFQKAQKWVEEMLVKYPDILKMVQDIRIDWGVLIQQVLDVLKNGAGGLLNSTVGFAGSLANGMMNTAFSFIFAMYMLLQKEKLCGQCRRVLYAWLPERITDKVMSVLTLANRIYSKFIAGQVLEAFILASMFFVTLTIFQFPYALLISVMVMFLALIPIIGPFIACVIGALLVFMAELDIIQALLFVVLFQVLQQIEGNFIYPHVMGTSIGLPPLWILFAVTVGGAAMGVFGMLLFIPACAVIYTLVKGSTRNRLLQKDIPQEKWEDPSS